MPFIAGGIFLGQIETGSFEGGFDNLKNDPINPLEIPTDDDYVGFLLGAPLTFDVDLAAGGAVPYNPNKFVFGSSYAFDVMYRWYIIPGIVNLSNPRLNVDVPFIIWNTFSQRETIDSFAIDGSFALQFDFGVNTEWKSAEYKTVNVQILPGEPTIDATITFETSRGIGIFGVLASLADTFNIPPELPVKEVWEYKSDRIVSYDGTEQRISLIPEPRITMSFRTLIQDERTRLSNYNLLNKNIQFLSLIPLYQYAVNPVAITEVGDQKIFLPMNRTNFRVDSFVVLINPINSAVVISKVTIVEPDGITLDVSATQEIDRTWVAVPAYSGLISNGSSINMFSVSGEITIDCDIYQRIPTLRPGATRSIDIFDGLPFINRRPEGTNQESFSYEKEIIDNSIGARIIESRRLHPEIAGPRRFVIQRLLDPDEMDYWRSFANSTRGAFKPFLLPTWMSDLTLIAPPVAGSSQISVAEGSFGSTYFPYDTWKRIQIEYADLPPTQHKIIGVTETQEGTAVLSLEPALSIDARVTSANKISYILKMVCGDVINLEHDATTTTIFLQTRTTDFG